MKASPNSWVNAREKDGAMVKKAKEKVSGSELMETTVLIALF